MNGSFNRNILVDKLAKLNNSQQSIETLSHWCIFHRNNAKQVVEIWERQFQCSAREQRISFLYLANDILQNSRRKGLEFINEFWKVLPEALIDVFGNGGDDGRKTVQRLVGIWEERKVFGSRGQILKEEILGRDLNNINKNVKPINHNQKQSSEILLEKIISSYDQIQDEDALFGKCQSAFSIIDKVEKEIENDNKLGNINRSEVIGELQIQHGIIGDCTEQLKSAELSRATLISVLREALNEQETKLEEVHQQLLAAESRYKQAGTISAQLNEEHPAVMQKSRETPSTFSGTPAYVPEANASSTGEAQLILSASTEENPLSDDKPNTEEENRKTAAAAMAAKLTESASSAQMLSFVLSTLASEGIISQTNKEESPDNKKIKLQHQDAPLQLPQPQPSIQFSMPVFSHPESILQLPPLQSPSPATHTNPPLEPPLMPPMSSAPPATLPPPSITQLMQSAAGTMTGVPYSYGSVPPPILQYPMFGMHPSPNAPTPFLGFQAPEGANLVVQPPPFPTGPPPLTRQ